MFPNWCVQFSIFNNRLWLELTFFADAIWHHLPMLALWFIAEKKNLLSCWVHVSCAECMISHLFIHCFLGNLFCLCSLFIKRCPGFQRKEAKDNNHIALCIALRKCRNSKKIHDWNVSSFQLPVIVFHGCFTNLLFSSIW